jgi:large subunit ribosomal protein L3
VPAVKVGMTQAWDAHGRRVPLTVLWVDAAAVTQVKRAAAGDATTALQISAGAVKPKNAHGRQAGHCAKAGLGRTARVAAEFRVTPDAALPLGHPLTAAHFAPGQFVDVAGTTLGKGFQGVMKRWGFAGQPASHGASRSHRSAGGIGACQDPGRVWKGKKMAGRMGGAARTVQSLRVAKVRERGRGGGVKRWKEGLFLNPSLPRSPDRRRPQPRLRARRGARARGRRRAGERRGVSPPRAATRPRPLSHVAPRGGDWGG